MINNHTNGRTHGPFSQFADWIDTWVSAQRRRERERTL